MPPLPPRFSAPDIIVDFSLSKGCNINDGIPKHLEIHSNCRCSLEFSPVRGEEHSTIIAPATLLPKHIPGVANCTVDHLSQDEMQCFFS